MFDGPADTRAETLDRLTHQAVRDWRGCGFNAATARLCAFAERLTVSPQLCGRELIEELRAVGWNDRAIHDATQIISYFNYINRVADALGVAPEPDLPVWGG